VSDQVDDDFDDRADLATADETIRLLRAEVARLRKWLNDALTVLEAPGASSNEQKRELAHAMLAALSGEESKP
jgi:hypothetical protein